MWLKAADEAELWQERKQLGSASAVRHLSEADFLQIIELAQTTLERAAAVTVHLDLVSTQLFGMRDGNGETVNRICNAKVKKKRKKEEIRWHQRCIRLKSRGSSPVGNKNFLWSCCFQCLVPSLSFQHAAWDIVSWCSLVRLISQINVSIFFLLLYWQCDTHGRPWETYFLSSEFCIVRCWQQIKGLFFCLTMLANLLFSVFNMSNTSVTWDRVMASRDKLTPGLVDFTGWRRHVFGTRLDPRGRTLGVGPIWNP